MEKNLSSYITQLIELDSRAVDFKGMRDSELDRLESGSRGELENIEKILEKTAAEARQEHDRIIGEARQEAKAVNEAAEAEADKLQAYFESIRERAAGDIWKQLLEIER